MLYLPQLLPRLFEVHQGTNVPICTLVRNHFTKKLFILILKSESTYLSHLASHQCRTFCFPPDLLPDKNICQYQHLRRCWEQFWCRCPTRRSSCPCLICSGAHHPNKQIWRKSISKVVLLDLASCSKFGCFSCKTALKIWVWLLVNFGYF